MNIKAVLGAAVGAFASCAGAFAEAPKPATPPATAPAAPVAAKPTAPAAPVAAKPAAAPVAGAMSESKFMSALYAEIAKRTPEENVAGPGEVTASFHVGASGKIDKVTIDKTTSPAHAEIVKKILADVSAPPPPGGSMDVGQTFRFH